MNELKEKEAQAIKVLRTFEPEEGYVLAYSGGKDSDCIKILAQLAGVKFEAVHNLTTADAPETMQYIKSQPDVRINWARDKDGKHITMWNLIEKTGLPTRVHRFCCNKLKESANQGRLLITGVRKAESVNRKRDGGLVKIMGKPKTTEKLAQDLGVEYSKPREAGLILNDDNDESRRMVEQCYRTRKTLVNPILDWTDEDVWEFLHHYGCESNPLYKCGHSRVGCIGCPMAGGKKMNKELEQHPKYAQMYFRATERMLERRIEQGKGIPLAWGDGKPETVMKWWLEN